MKKNSVVMSAKVERRVTDPAPVFRTRTLASRQMATRLDLPRPADVTPIPPVTSDPDPDNRIMDLRDVATRINTTARNIVRALVVVAAMLVAVALWRVWG